MAELNADNSRPIIKKVKKVSGDGHHGGAWKVAYADFVTAMMAFFLMMWLLNATSEEQRQGIADYFSPRIPISEESGGGDSLFQGSTIFTSKDLAQSDVGGKEKSNETELSEEEIEARIQEAAQALVESQRDADAQVAVESALNALQQAGDDNELLDHLSIKVTPEGLMIEIADKDGAPLFAAGSASPAEKMRLLIAVIAPIITKLENKIAIAGHTDATPFATPGPYGNWELSTDRANAARRLLLSEGFPIERLAKVTGAADTNPLNTADPYAPQNRRIAITLLRGADGGLSGAPQ